MTDWFRRKTWTKNDEEEFFTKLGRARKGTREQYLKIQAMELFATKQDRLRDIAETLLQKFLTDYPDDEFNRGSVYETLGNIHQYRQNNNKAIEYYKQAIAYEKIFPNRQTNAYLYYSELVIKFKMHEEYDFVKMLIKERESKLLFPIEKYKAYSILSIIYAYHKEKDLAIKYAQLAKQSGNAGTSGLRYHKDLALVTENDRWLDKLVYS